MLQAYTGTFDSRGVLSLRIERDSPPRGGMETAGQFWAVVDSDDMALIYRTLRSGDRIRAFELIADHCCSMGTILLDGQESYRCGEGRNPSESVS